MSVHDVIFVIGTYVIVSILGAILQRIWPILGPAADPIAQRLARLEREIDQINKHLGIEQRPPLDKVQELLARGLAISAIKAYREQNGVSLAEAKEAVDRMKAEMRVSGLV